MELVKENWVYLFCNVYIVWRKFLISMCNVLNILSQYMYFYIWKTITPYTFSLVHKMSNTFSVSLMASQMQKIKFQQQSIPEVLRMRNVQIWLATTSELRFSWVCSFCRTLRNPKKNHKNFQFQTKLMTSFYFKSPKTLFWGHFWPFNVFFPKYFQFWDPKDL